MPPRSMATAGAKSRPRIRWSRLLSRRWLGLRPGVVLAGLLVAGCSEATVAARAVWIGSEHELDGGRTLYAYAAGSMIVSHIGALSADGTDATGPLLVELEPRGRGVLVRAVDNGWLHEVGTGTQVRGGYIDLAGVRALPLTLPSAHEGSNFLASGAGLWWPEACPQALAVVPLGPDVVLTRDADGTIAPLRHVIAGDAGKPAPRSACTSAEVSFGAVSPTDAPRVVLVATRGQVPDVRAEQEAAIEVLEVPIAGAGPLTRSVVGKLPAGHVPVRLPDLRCTGGPACQLAAVDPDGAGVTFAVYGADCRLLRFDTATGESRCAVASDAPPELSSAHLIAAISGDHYVFRDGLTLLRHDWRTGEQDSRTLPGDADDAFVRVTADGRVVVIGATSGPVLRADVDALDILSIEQGVCANPQPPVISPSGRFAAWTCTIGLQEADGMMVDDEPDADALALGDVVRVSGAGTSRYQGVPMWTLAIDDAGALLMHSRKTPRLDRETLLPPDPPRNLYVLAQDGELARIDSLEPDPERTQGISVGTYRWITARPL